MSWLPKDTKSDMMVKEYTAHYPKASSRALAPQIAKHLDEVIIRRNIKPDNKGSYHFTELLYVFLKYVGGRKNFSGYLRNILRDDYDYKFRISGKLITITKIS